MLQLTNTVALGSVEVPSIMVFIIGVKGMGALDHEFTEGHRRGET